MGCAFAARCPVAIAQCHTDKPPLEKATDNHFLRCWRWQDIANGDLVPKNPPIGKHEDTAPQPGYVLKAQHIHKTFSENRLLDRLFGKKPRPVQALTDVSIKINQRSTLGLVGESGSGKTTLARAIVGLDTADSGSLELLDMPVNLHLDKRGTEILRNLRLIFQNPNDALNPYRTVRETIGRTIQLLGRDSLTKSAIESRIIALLEAVGLTAAYADRYPQQLSGGEKQRVAIARAFSAKPALIIADEPTSALDVSVQAVILNLLKDLRAENGASYLFISHDLEVIRYLADWIVVMYLGEIVEQGTNEQVSHPPMHPYTEALLSAAPLPDPTIKPGTIRLTGEIPSPRNKPTGCPFHTRCPRYLGDICKHERPPLREDDEGHMIRCHIPLDDLKRLQSQEQMS
jgi:peptide/nickel transport system ATP-binding protein